MLGIVLLCPFLRQKSVSCQERGSRWSRIHQSDHITRTPKRDGAKRMNEAHSLSEKLHYICTMPPSWSSRFFPGQ